jgi:hypothetical protein
VVEGTDGSDRKIKTISFNGVDYAVNSSVAIGLWDIDGINYLTFLCKIGKKEIRLYCDSSDYKNYKYFTLK